MSRPLILTLSLALATLAACQRDAAPRAARTAAMRVVNTPVRISMDELHRTGGVPPNWVFALPTGDVDAGREAFVHYGCHTCHVVQGEDFVVDPAEVSPGPDLTGMGSHHPEVYFVESILNPDAVIVEGPGYEGADGRSTMPAYPDLSLEDLVHLVTYIKSLDDPDADPHAHHMMGAEMPFSGRVDLTQSDTPQEAEEASARSGEPPKSFAFFVQTYSVREGQLAALERWFEAEGGPAFRSFEQLQELDTHVDRTRGPESMVTIFGFSHMEHLRDFLADRRVGEAFEKFDDFGESIERQIYETRPLYRVGSLSK